MDNKEEKIRDRNTKKLHKILDRYDDITDVKKREQYFLKRLPKFTAYKENANLDEIVFKNLKLIRYNEGDSAKIQYKKAQSALMWAISAKKYDLAEDFIARGADINKNVKTSNVYDTKVSVYDTLHDKESVLFCMTYGFKFSPKQIECLKNWGNYPTQPKVEQNELATPKLKPMKQAKEREREM